MDFNSHCLKSEKLFGQRFENVHRWLDEYAGQPNIGLKHRKFRHHQAGIEEVAGMFGEEAAKTAKQHIVDDLHEEGWRETKDRMPRNSADYEAMGLY